MLLLSRLFEQSRAELIEGAMVVEGSANHYRKLYRLDCTETVCPVILTTPRPFLRPYPARVCQAVAAVVRSNESHCRDSGLRSA